MRLLVGDDEDAVVQIAQANLSFLAHEAADHPEKARAYLRAIDEQVERISDALRGFFHQQKISEFLKERNQYFSRRIHPVLAVAIDRNHAMGK